MFEIEDVKEDFSELPLADKIERSISILRLASEMSYDYYGKPFICCYSGGKDSDVLLQLCKMALPLNKFEVMSSHTTVDAPETVYHIRDVIKDLNNNGGVGYIHYPHDKDGRPISMWSLIVQRKMPPTRIARYCCSVLKEISTPNRMAVLGVRAAESQNRKNRDVFSTRGMRGIRDAKFFSLSHAEEVYRESKEINDPAWDCTLIKTMKDHKDTIVNAIYDWSDTDVWDFIKQENIKVNPLYARGYKRVGCIGCPLAGRKERLKAFADYPIYKLNYIRAFDRMIKQFDCRNKDQWASGEDVFNWWMEDNRYNVKGQMSIDDLINEVAED